MPALPRNLDAQDAEAEGESGVRMNYYSIDVDGRTVGEHIHIAEVAIGKKLPKGAMVHHVDGNPRNNAGSNLVICPSDAYHKLLHNRQNSLRETGHLDWRMCHICKKWDAPGNLYFRKSRPGQWHRACANVLRKRRLQKASAL